MCFVVRQSIALLSIVGAACFFLMLPAQARERLPVVSSNDQVQIAQDNTAPYRSASLASSRIDRWHEKVYEDLHTRVVAIDRIFAKDKNCCIPVPGSCFESGLYVKTTETDGECEVEVEPDASADVRLANMEHRLGLFLDRIDPGERVTGDPVDTKNRYFLGLRQVISHVDDRYIDVKVGGHLTWPVEGYVTLRARTTWGGDTFRVTPSQEGFWRTEEGFGERTGIKFDWTISRSGFSRSESWAQVTEESDGVELDQVFVLGCFLDPGERVRRSLISLTASASGHDGDGRGAIVDEYRGSILFRKAMYKDWLYGEIKPEVKFTNEREWAPIHSIRVGVFAVFEPEWSGL